MKHPIKVSRVPRKYTARGKAFSLLELSIVIVIMSVVAVMGLELANQFVARRAYSETQNKLTALDTALVKFYRIYGRLPCPADRSLDPFNTNFGLEACTANANVAWSGTIPFRVLNLSLEDVMDAYGNQFNYVLSKGLDDATTFSATTPAITIRSGLLNLACAVNCQALTSQAAYAVFSAGINQQGGVSRQGTTTACVLDATGRPDEQNCAVATADPTGVPGIGFIATTLYDNRFNTGIQAANYFDDLILWRTKGRL